MPGKGRDIMDEHAATPRGMRTFFIIWGGQIISIVGSGLTAFALGVWIFEQTGQATPFALTVMFASVPRILLSPVAGALADRVNRRQLMILADSGDALVTLGAFLLLTRGDLAVWHIYVIAALSSVFAAFQEPAYTASITMLVPKKDLARASGMVQMGQAAEMLVSPILAGLLFVSIGFRGIVLIDFVTYFFAIGALLLVDIPQPKPAAEPSAGDGGLMRDVAFGWSYLRARAGLFGLLLYFALVNFSVNFAAVLTGPLVLSFASPSVMGLVQTISGVGMLVGSVVMSAWGGPQRRILAVLGFIALGSVGLGLVGLRPSPWTIAAGLFTLMFAVPLAAGPSQAIFQSKVEPGVQGRVFAMRTMIARSMMPVAFLSAGPLADQVFEPLLRPGGALASGAIATVFGVGPGRGIGLIYVLAAIILLGATALAFAHPRIRNIEDELPDVVPEEELSAAPVPEAVAAP